MKPGPGLCSTALVAFAGPVEPPVRLRRRERFCWGGVVTISVTPAVPGAAAGAGVKTTVAVYFPFWSPVGFTRKFRSAGSAPVSGVAVSHCPPGGFVVIVLV